MITNDAPPQDDLPTGDARDPRLPPDPCVFLDHAVIVDFEGPGELTLEERIELARREGQQLGNGWTTWRVPAELAERDPAFVDACTERILAVHPVPALGETTIAADGGLMFRVPEIMRPHVEGLTAWMGWGQQVERTLDWALGSFLDAHLIPGFPGVGQPLPEPEQT